MTVAPATMPTGAVAPGPGRILALDLARSGALVAMALFHFVFDLEMFGWVPRATSTTGGWRLLALCTAGSFLFLAGLSLWLAHGAGVRWRGFRIRLLKIVAAAALVSVATYLAFPDAFVFFGILHAIAASSVLGLLFLRVPVWGLLIAGGLLFYAPYGLRSGVFDAAWLWWTGLQTVTVRSVDYVPIAPWFAPFLLGMAAGRLGTHFGTWGQLAQWSGGRFWRAMAWPGKHSLPIYLIHQPVLIGGVWAATVLLRG